MTDLSPIVDALCLENANLLRGRRRKLGRSMLPSRERVASVLGDLRGVLFPWHFGAADVSEAGLAYYVGRTLDSALSGLREQVLVGLLFDCDDSDGRCAQCETRAEEVTAAFASRLPAVRALLGSDAQAAFDGDPAATSADEAVFSYAGMSAIIHHRLAHELYGLGAENHREYEQRILAVDAAAVRAVAQRIIRFDAACAALLGPADAVVAL